MARREGPKIWKHDFLSTTDRHLLSAGTSRRFKVGRAILIFAPEGSRQFHSASKLGPPVLSHNILPTLCSRAQVPRRIRQADILTPWRMLFQNSRCFLPLPFNVLDKTLFDQLCKTPPITSVKRISRSIDSINTGSAPFNFCPKTNYQGRSPRPPPSG
jgi:hypothetical protein